MQIKKIFTKNYIYPMEYTDLKGIEYGILPQLSQL